MQLNTNPDLPDENLPICIIGTGGIVKDAHLPAYHKAGFQIHSLTDVHIDKARNLAVQYDVDNVFDSVENAVANAPENAVFDLALIPDQLLPVLGKLPEGAPVLIQKPMGSQFNEAREIYLLCKQKKLKAGLNFQLRYAPFVKAARSIIQSGKIGNLYDIEIRVTVHTPWEIFPSVMNQERLEILYHSIHYIDLIRSFLGNPSSVMAKTLRHPEKSVSSTRTTILLDYNDTIHAVINTNHDHEFGKKNQESFIKWEGTKGAIKARMGLLMNYPEGEPDLFEYCIRDENGKCMWVEEDLEGSWFPDAFVDTMSGLMRYAVSGKATEMPTNIEDSLGTMAVLEGAYASNQKGGVNIQHYLNI